MPADISRRAGDAVRELVRLDALRSAWLPGMRGLWSDTIGRSYAPRVEDFYNRGRAPWMDRPSARPDTDDPLTVFGLLLLAREAWGDDHATLEWWPPMYASPSWPPARDDLRVSGWWRFLAGYGDGVRRYDGATEAEAIVAALEAAAEARRA